MNKFVVDSCIFAKLFLQEEDRQYAIDFFVAANRERWQILVPALFKFEVLNIVRRRKIDFEIAYSILEQNLNTVIDVIDIDKRVMQKALSICQEGNSKSGYPSVYDSVYHSLAILNGCDFLTMDTKHYSKTKHMGNIALLKDCFVEDRAYLN